MKAFLAPIVKKSVLEELTFAFGKFDFLNLANFGFLDLANFTTVDKFSILLPTLPLSALAVLLSIF